MTTSDLKTRKVGLMTNKTVQLVETPSKDDVVLAWRSRHQGSTITVSDDKGVVYTLDVLGLEHEDGSGSSWNIKGYMKRMDTSRLKIHSATLGQYTAHLNYKGGPSRGTLTFKADSDVGLKVPG